MTCFQQGIKLTCLSLVNQVVDFGRWIYLVLSESKIFH